MFTVFLFYEEKELFTGEGCVEMDSPWQSCRTIGPLTLHSQEIRGILSSQTFFDSMGVPYITVKRQSILPG